jgi:hypothetical protein
MGSSDHRAESRVQWRIVATMCERPCDHHPCDEVADIGQRDPLLERQIRSNLMHVYIKCRMFISSSKAVETVIRVTSVLDSLSVRAPLPLNSVVCCYVEAREPIEPVLICSNPWAHAAEGAGDRRFAGEEHGHVAATLDGRTRVSVSRARRRPESFDVPFGRRWLIPGRRVNCRAGRGRAISGNWAILANTGCISRSPSAAASMQRRRERRNANLRRRYAGNKAFRASLGCRGVGCHSTDSTQVPKRTNNPARPPG